MPLRTLVLLLVGLSACAEPTDPAPSAPPPPELSVRPPLQTAADSLAWRITRAAGGLDAWTALPLLRFDWAGVRDSSETFRARHLWDRRQNRYRVEYPVGADSVLVALFDPTTFTMAAPAGRAFINGVALDSAATTLRLADAYERYINDTYWLIAPLKLFDPGVRRALAPDSSDATSDVLLLSFENVGLTPGDRYWIRADSTGRVLSWSYLLEGNESGMPGYYAWEDVVDLDTPRGPLHLARRKARSGRQILTEPIPLDALAADVWEAPAPRL